MYKKFPHLSFFPNFLKIYFFMEVRLTYNVVLIPAIPQSVSIGPEPCLQGFYEVILSLPGVKISSFLCLLPVSYVFVLRHLRP